MTQVENQIVNLSPLEKRKLLAQLLQQGSREGFTNLTVEQRRLWLLRQLEESVPTHVFRAYVIDGELNIASLREALDEVVRRQEMLRVSFIDIEGRPMRVLSQSAQVKLALTDLTDKERQAFDLGVQSRAVHDALQPFDLSAPPLLRLNLIRESERRHVLLITMHELIADDYSLSLFIGELIEAYVARCGSARLPSEPLTARFSDFVKWQHDWLQSEEYARQLAYWKKKLSGAPILELPTDRPRPAVRTHSGARRSRLLSADALSGLEELGRRHGASLSTVALAAFQALLSLYSGGDEIVVGLESAARPRSEFEGLIGPLTNTLVIRSTVAGDPDFGSLLEQVTETLAEAHRHSDVPYGRLIEELQPQRDLSRTPLFQVKFAFRQSSDLNIVDGTLTLRPLDLDTGAALFDLTLLVNQRPDGLLLTAEFNTDLFEPATAERLLEHLQAIFANVIENPLRRMSELVPSHEPERLTIPEQREDASETYVGDHCLHQLIEKTVEERAEAIALSFEGEHITYGELNRRANQLARYLISLGLKVESKVAVMVERGVEAVVGLLAVMKGGGAYVPLDPTYPRDRLSFMVKDSQAELLLTRKAFAEVVADAGARVVYLDTEAEAIANCSSTNPSPAVSPDDLAYIIYTSGSTGRPKGVMLAHRGVVNNLLWRQKQWPLAPSDRVLQSYSFSFDPSVWATFWPLLAGSCVVIPRAEANLDSVALTRLMAEERITVFGAAPSIHSILADEPAFQSCDSLRYIFSGGELLDALLQQQLQRLPRAELYNVYGPTEATIDCTYWHCPRVPEPASAPIGSPISNTAIYIVNRHLRLNPIGAPGEICIRSVGLARGYVGAPALTAEKFVPDPFSGIPGSRMYRTGDMGRLSSDGTLEFIGRVDDQVKVRGFRIELSEIERNLARHEGVREAAVIVKRNSAADARLIAYFAPAASVDAPGQSELAEFLGERLPHYMVPDLFVALESLPRTPTGKVDKNSLPAVEEGDERGGREYRPPRDQLETEISQIIGNVLGLERLSIDDDIFDLGSNSLLIARIASRLSSAYQIDLPVQQIFKDPTVASIAALVDIYRREGNLGAMTSWTIEQVEAEAELSPEITAEGLPPFEYCTPKSVFLTGATGYLGAFILERLLRTGPAECFCLVRASSPEQGLERIREAMKGYRIWDDSFAARIHPVVGDIAKPEMGVGSEEFARLASEVDTIYHCGALVNFIYPYSALRGPNVLGTHEVLRLATRGKLKPVHYTSTVDVLLGTHMKRPFYETDEVLYHPNEIPDGYARSKLVAEKMLANARLRGVPVCVYRPGLIMGHTATGATQTNDYLLVGLKGYIDLGMLAEPSIMIDFVTVDFVAAAIVHLSMQPESIGRYFHIWNPWPVHMSRAYEWVNSFGYHLKVVPGNILRDKVLKEVDVSNVLYPFLPLFRAMRDNPPISSHDPRIMEKINLMEECRNMLEGLKGSGIECPQLDERLAHLCLSYLVSIGFLPEPAVYAQNLA
jgi:myxalamid-type nonribosomal peptide synthetase MxaA